MVVESKLVCHDRHHHMEYKFEEVKPVDIVAAVRQCVNVFTVQKELQRLGDQIKNEFLNVFSEIPHINELPTDVYCHIKLKDASKSVKTCTYSTPQKYHEAWSILIPQHLDAG
jgi:hypothetical protein